MFRLSVLTDNHAGGTFLAEHGLSYLIEVNNTCILFDTGHSDVFLQNADRLGYSLSEKIDYIVLSHGHWDHGNGLQHINNTKLITHPSSFMKRYRERDNSYIGLNRSREEIAASFELIESSAPYKITDSIFFLGEVPRTNNFKAGTTSFITDDRKADFVPDDSAIAIVHNSSLSVISGCAHAGICNTIEYAKQVTGVSTVHAVVGGFHLKKDDEQTRKTVDYLQSEHIQHLHPSHCTELPALSVLFQQLGATYLTTGTVKEF